jgi:GNAT superfamily N-acetyltransferase
MATMLTTTDIAAPTYRRDLGDGLVLRWSTAQDSENIAQLVGFVFREKADEPPDHFLANMVRRLMRGDHPLMGPGDYALVEDTRKDGNPLVAGVCLQRLDWEYEGIPFHIGRPEVVASDPAYRKRGLIRALFEMVHARSAAEGHMVQAITGIPYFYRQFGYEYALDLGGRRITYLSLIPKAKEGQTEPYVLREATVEDIPLLQKYYNLRRSASVVWTTIPDHFWRYNLEAWKANPERDRTDIYYIIVDSAGTPGGYVAMAAQRRSKRLEVWNVAVEPGVNWQAVLPPVLRALQRYGAQIPTSKPDVEPFSEISFVLERTHPVYDVLGKELAPLSVPPYAWYVRVPDLPAFIKHIAPALEKRLAESVLAGYSDELKLDFYRGGLRMVFTSGRLETVEHWPVPVYDANASAGFPALVFLQLLFGRRSLDELRYAFPDVWASNDAALVLQTLFPALPSFVMPL